MRTNSKKKILEVANRNELIAYIDSKVCVMTYDSESIDKAKSDFQLKKETIDGSGFYVTNVLFTAILGMGTEDEWLDNASGITSIRFAVDKSEPTESMIIVSDAFGDFGSHRWSFDDICDGLGLNLDENSYEDQIKFVKELKPVDLLYIYYLDSRDYWENMRRQGE